MSHSFFLFFLIAIFLHNNYIAAHYYTFTIKEVPYTKLCSTKKILTVNGQFPGPILKVHKGDTIYVKVRNEASVNITLHWHGVEQRRNPWSDGPAYITQCPIQSGSEFTYKVIFSIEEATVWWHAHSSWTRATVHGLIFVYPLPMQPLPFPQVDYEVPLVLGEWWKKDVREVVEEFIRTGGPPNVSDALTINGHPGFLYPCSKSDTFELVVEKGKTYRIRMVNAAMDLILFFEIANHNLTVIVADGHNTKPLNATYITIAPGETLDALLHADQNAEHIHYMAARAYSTIDDFNNSTTVGILRYKDVKSSSNSKSYPNLPYYNDTSAAFGFFNKIRSLRSGLVSTKITRRIISTISINLLPCPLNSCEGPNGSRLAASMNNISFVTPNHVDILKAYYLHINGVFGTRFPSFPPLIFNFTAEDQPLYLQTPRLATELKVIEYGEMVEMVIQGTSVVVEGGLDHPMHLHGFSFFVVGVGSGNFNLSENPLLKYNLDDPPYKNTATVPRNGWIAIRFIANNPGIWFMHCHLDRHQTWGMNVVFIVKNGIWPNQHILPPPHDLPPCY